VARPECWSQRRSGLRPSNAATPSGPDRLPGRRHPEPHTRSGVGHGLHDHLPGPPAPPTAGRTPQAGCHADRRPRRPHPARYRPPSCRLPVQPRTKPHQMSAARRGPHEGCWAHGFAIAEARAGSTEGAPVTRLVPVARPRHQAAGTADGAGPRTAVTCRWRRNAGSPSGTPSHRPTASRPR
jgi:hypothetical protein